MTNSNKGGRIPPNQSKEMCDIVRRNIVPRVECVRASWVPDGEFVEYFMCQLTQINFEIARQGYSHLGTMPRYFRFDHVDRQTMVEICPEPNSVGTLIVSVKFDGVLMFLKRRMGPGIQSASNVWDNVPSGWYMPSSQYLIGMDTANPDSDVTCIVTAEVVDGGSTEPFEVTGADFFVPFEAPKKAEMDWVVDFVSNLKAEALGMPAELLVRQSRQPDFLTSWLAHQATEAADRAMLQWPGVWPPPREGRIPE